MHSCRLAPRQWLALMPARRGGLKDDRRGLRTVDDDTGFDPTTGRVRACRVVPGIRREAAMQGGSVDPKMRAVARDEGRR